MKIYIEKARLGRRTSSCCITLDLSPRVGQPDSNLLSCRGEQNHVHGDTHAGCQAHAEAPIPEVIDGEGDVRGTDEKADHGEGGKDEHNSNSFHGFHTKNLPVLGLLQTAGISGL